jgi:tetratricopeptide (TPR) repeat protein
MLLLLKYLSFPILQHQMGRHAEAIALLREGENDLEDGSVLLFSMLLQAVAIKMVELESPARVDTDSVDPMEQARQDWAAEDDHDVPAQEGTLDALCSRLFSAFENMSDSDKAVAMAAAASDASGGATANTNEGGGVADGTETNGAVFSGAVCAYVKHIRDSLPDPKEGVEAHWGAWMKLTERCRQLYEQCTGVVTPLPVDCLSVCLEASLGGDLDKKLVSKMADEVLEVDPENGVALVSRGCVLSCLRPPDFAVATGTNMAERQIERSRAADCLKRGLTTFSACSLGWMVLGKLRQEEGVFAEAVDAFSRAAQAAVKDNGVGKDLSQIKFQANVSKIEALAKMKKIMQAWEGVKKLELEAPNTNDSVRIKRIVGVKGALLAAEGRWKEVAEMLKSGSEGLGNHLYPWSLLKLGRTEEAMTIFETKLSRAQDDGSVCSDGELWASLGFVYTQVGGEFITNKKFAFKHLLQGAKLNPGLALAFRGLGAYYLNQDLQDRAVQCMQKALKLDPNDADAGQALSAVYVKSEQWTLATALWESCVDIDKGAIWAWKNLARMHLSKQHFRATNLVVLDIDNVEDGGLPQSADAVHGDISHASNACRCFQQIIRVEPKHLDAWVGLGESYFLQGRQLASYKSFLRAEELAKESREVEDNGRTSVLVTVSFFLGRVESAMGKYDTAIAHMQLPMETSNRNILIASTYAEILFKAAQTYTIQGLSKRAYSCLKEGVKVIDRSIGEKPDMKYLYKLKGHLATYSYMCATWVVDDSSSVAEDDDLLQNVSCMQFVASGTVAYQKLITILENELAEESDTDVKKRLHEEVQSTHYDLATNYLFQASAYNILMCESAGLLSSHTYFENQVGTLLRDACATLKLVVQGDPCNSLGWNALGHAAKQQPSAGMSAFFQQHCFIRAIQLDALPSAWMNLSTLYMQMRRPELAHQSLLELQKFYASSPKMWTSYGLLAEFGLSTRNGIQTDPTEAYKLALERQPLQDANLGLGYNAAVSEIQADSAVLASKADVEERSSLISRAKAALITFIDREPNNPYALNLLGVIMQEHAHYAQSIHHFEAALAAVELLRERWAKKMLPDTELMAFNTAVVRVRQNMAYSLAMSGKNGSYAAIVKCLAFDGIPLQHPFLSLIRAKALQREGRLGEALEDLQASKNAAAAGGSAGPAMRMRLTECTIRIITEAVLRSDQNADAYLNQLTQVCRELSAISRNEMSDERCLQASINVWRTVIACATALSNWTLAEHGISRLRLLERAPSTTSYELLVLLSRKRGDEAAVRRYARMAVHQQPHCARARKLLQKHVIADYANRSNLALEYPPILNCSIGNMAAQQADAHVSTSAAHHADSLFLHSLSMLTQGPCSGENEERGQHNVEKDAFRWLLKAAHVDPVRYAWILASLRKGDTVSSLSSDEGPPCHSSLVALCAAATAASNSDSESESGVPPSEGGQHACEAASRCLQEGTTAGDTAAEDALELLRNAVRNDAQDSASWKCMAAIYLAHGSF